MNARLQNNVLTVVTAIPEEVAKKGIVDLVAKNDKGHEVYRVSKGVNGQASLDAFSMSYNTFVDGFVAATIILPVEGEVTMDDVQKKYGKALLAANLYTTQIAEDAATEATQIAALFE